jgi:hypothetical protein
MESRDCWLMSLAYFGVLIHKKEAALMANTDICRASFYCKTTQCKGLSHMDNRSGDCTMGLLELV